MFPPLPLRHVGGEGTGGVVGGLRFARSTQQGGRGFFVLDTTPPTKTQIIQGFIM